MPPLLLKLLFDRIGRTPMPFFVRRSRARFAGSVMAVSSARSSNSSRLHGVAARYVRLVLDGEFSAADVAIVSLEIAVAKRKDLTTAAPI